MEHTWTNGDFNVPKIEEDRLQELIKRFTPLYAVEKSTYHNNTLVKSKIKIMRIEIPHPRNVAFTWDPKITKKVKFKEIMKVKTYHSCGYHAFVKPSIAEVLANIQDNKKLLDTEANGFYIDMSNVEIHSSGSGHILTTVFGKIS